MTLMEIPEDVLTSIKIPKKEFEKELKINLTVVLYQRDAISLGKARKLADMNKWEFLEELGKRKIPRHYTEKELGEDLAFAKSGM